MLFFDLKWGSQEEPKSERNRSKKRNDSVSFPARMPEPPLCALAKKMLRRQNVNQKGFFFRCGMCGGAPEAPKNLGSLPQIEAFPRIR